MLFRLQNNVPEVYVNESRDFQLFCRLYDSAFNSTKYSIDSLQRATSTKECDATLLDLLKTKLGLFSTVEVPDDSLRYILTAFPVIMRYKGSKIAIDYILTLYSRLSHSENAFATYDEAELINSRLILTFASAFKVDELLFELLQYVLPTGFLIEYKIVSVDSYNSYIRFCDKLTYNVSTVNELSEVLPEGKDNHELKSNVGLTVIAENEATS